MFYTNQSIVGDPTELILEQPPIACQCCCCSLEVLLLACICVGLFEPQFHIFEVYILIFVVNSELYGHGCVCHNFKLSDVPSCLHLCPRLHISIRPAPGISCHHIFHRWMFVSSHNILRWESLALSFIFGHHVMIYRLVWKHLTGIYQMMY